MDQVREERVRENLLKYKKWNLSFEANIVRSAKIIVYPEIHYNQNLFTLGEVS